MRRLKKKTYELLSKAINSGELYFPDKHPYAECKMGVGFVRQIVKTEYGITTKNTRILRKKLKQIVNDMLRDIVETLEDENLENRIREVEADSSRSEA